MTLSGETLHERLRRATRREHEAVETAVDTKAAFDDLQTYKAYLIKLFGLMSPYEDALSSASTPLTLPEFKRVKLLKADLHDLGLSDAQIDKIPLASITQFSEETSLLGVRYVLEGSALGGRILLKQYGDVLKISETFAGRYMASDKQVFSSWSILKEKLQQMSSVGIEADEIELSAKQTFLIFLKWFSQ